MPVLDDLMDNEIFAREYRKGVMAGIEEGIEKGIEQGIGKGEAKLLHRLILRRFKRIPKWAEAQLAASTPEQIEKWGLRLLDAPTLRGVFDSK